MTENQKLDHLWDTVVNEYKYSIWWYFVGQAGGLEQIKSGIRDLNTTQELDRYVSKYI